MIKRILTVCGVLALGAVPSFANIFGINNVTIDLGDSSPVIAPFTANCPPYPDLSCPVTSPTTYPLGFPVSNIFGAGIQTGEGTYDTIFSSPGVDTVYFKINNPASLSGTFELTVAGSSGDRDITGFSLLSSSTGVGGSYTSVFSSPGDVFTSPVTLSGAGPYFEYQFDSTSQYGSGARIFGVSLTSATPEPGFYGLLGLGLSGLAIVVSRRKRAKA